MTSKAARRLSMATLVLIVAGCSGRDDDATAALSDADPQVRRTAIRALAASNDDPNTALPALLPVLEDHDESVRVTAALEVQKLEPKNARCQAILTEALRDGQGPVFLEIGQSGEKATWAVPTLLSLLTDRRAPIRALAAQTIGQIGVADDRVTSALRRGLRDESPVVRKACEKALAAPGPSATP